MRIQSITLFNFWSFGNNPTTVDLSEDITVLVGANGTGKTAVMTALNRLFGTSRDDRLIRKHDFFTSPSEPSNDGMNTKLYLEVILRFPELELEVDENGSIPPTFNHMLVSEPGADPVCRIRLEADWEDDGTSEGSIEQNLYWITTLDDTPEDDKKIKVKPEDRGLIQAHYIPAVRNPSTELRYTSGTRMGRLLRAISWSDETIKEIARAYENIQNILESQNSMHVINDSLQFFWDSLNDDVLTANAELSFTGSRKEEILRNTTMIFKSGADNQLYELDRLSEGQLSLFYLSLVGSVFRIEQDIQNSSNETNVDSNENDWENSSEQPIRASGFRSELLHIPVLTIFAFEELENHLSPHMLARAYEAICKLSKYAGAQIIVSSHSPVLLSRVNPEAIRHFRLELSNRITLIRSLEIPESPEDAAKYVRGALQLYPEIYFAKLVILAEGPSEQIVLPRIAESGKIELDKSFACVLPIGGRHVNLLWRLLTDLNIPFLSLLDLDVGRESGGWAKIKYILTQLLNVGKDENDLLNFRTEEGENFKLTKEELDRLHRKDLNSLEEFLPWIKHLETFNVYFSFPLDLDWSMLKEFPEEYKKAASGGPNIPDPSKDYYDDYIRNSIASVISTNEKSVKLYYDKILDKQLFPWYRYMFLNLSKPGTHIQAVMNIEQEKLWKDTPSSLKRLLEKCRAILAGTGHSDD